MKKYPDTDFDLKTIENGKFEVIELKKGWFEDRNILNVPHRHTFHEIVWVKQGNDFHVVDYEDYLLAKNQILCIPKNSIHDFKPSELTTGWKLIFDESFFTVNQQQVLSDFLLFIPNLGNKAFSLNAQEAEIVNFIFALLNTINTLKQKQALIINLLIFIEDCYTSKINKSDYGFIDFIKLLNKEIYTHKEVAYYAAQLGISQKKLNEIIKKTTGKTTQNYIHARLINEAKSKLRYSNCSIKEIAYSLGFNDALYFSRFFKQKANNTPENYRTYLPT
jgi:AraC family transcriptional regulator, transcriptional activator of pobA